MDFSLDHIDSFVEDIDRASSTENLIDILKAHTVKLGFERFTYWLTAQPDGSRCSYWVSSYPVDWTSYYGDKNFGSDDLVMRYSANHLNPYTWKDAKAHYTMTGAQRKVFAEGAEAGIRAGASIPFHGPGSAKAIFSIANDEQEDAFQRLFQSRRHHIHLFGHYAHHKILSLANLQPTVPNLNLSARELEVLTWTSRGKTRWEIGEVLGVSEDTVKEHLKNSCMKLGAQNKTHATAIALMQGLIKP